MPPDTPAWLQSIAREGSTIPAHGCAPVEPGAQNKTIIQALLRIAMSTLVSASTDERGVSYPHTDGGQDEHERSGGLFLFGAPDRSGCRRTHRVVGRHLQR